MIDFELFDPIDDDFDDLEDMLLVAWEPIFPRSGVGGIAVFGAEGSYGGFAGASVGPLAVAASALREVARQEGYPLSDAELRILLAHAAFESGFGRGDPSRNTLANTNNWGSVQATKPWVQAHLGQPGFGAVAHQDSDPKKGSFIGWYAVYPNAVEGARHFFDTVKGAITTDIDQYAANLYHRGYYGGVHANDPQANIRDYAAAIKRNLPSSVPQDSPASVDAAKKFSVGPFAPAANRMTAKFKVDGKVKWPASLSDAQQAWESSWSSPAAYGLGLLGKALDFGSIIASDGVVWLGAPPAGFASPDRGWLSLLPLAGAVVGAIAGMPWKLAGIVIGSVAGAGLGFVVERIPTMTGLLALASAPDSPASAAILTATPPPDLKTIQAKLNALGMASPPLKTDGIMGPLTQSALQKFQKSKGLMMTGIVDAATVKALG